MRKEAAEDILAGNTVLQLLFYISLDTWVAPHKQDGVKLCSSDVGAHGYSGCLLGGGVLHNSDVDSERDKVLSSKRELKVSILSEISPHPSPTSTYKKSTLHLMLIKSLIN